MPVTATDKFGSVATASIALRTSGVRKESLRLICQFGRCAFVFYSKIYGSQPILWKPGCQPRMCFLASQPGPRRYGIQVFMTRPWRGSQSWSISTAVYRRRLRRREFAKVGGGLMQNCGPTISAPSPPHAWAFSGPVASISATIRIQRGPMPRNTLLPSWVPWASRASIVLPKGIT